MTGERTIKRGPLQYFMTEDEKLGRRSNGIVLSETQYLMVEHQGTGVQRCVVGPQVFFPEALETFDSVKNASQIRATEYARVRVKTSGDVYTLRGPTLFIPKPTEELLETKTALALSGNQYVRVVDKRSAVNRVVRGECLLFLDTYEELVGGIQTGVNVDTNQAVLVRNIESGQLELIIEKQVFIPKSNQEVVEVRQKIRLEDYHTAVVKNNLTGQLVFRQGPDSFFLEPYTELFEVRWSTGIYKDSKNLRITLFDSRPKFMWYEFECRTKDNVEVILGVTFFWSLADVKKMILTSDDAAGDVCSHARSVIIQAISQIDLEQFLQTFNIVIPRAVKGETDTFYTQRGLLIHETEVRSISCKDPSTQKILQEIIKERTNLINQLQKQQVENEVSIKKREGEIEAEKMRGRLLEIKKDLVEKEGEMEGDKEASRVRAFLRGIDGEISDPQKKMEMFTLLQKVEIMRGLSASNAKMIFTPADVDLRVAAQGL
eukprot:TRINITY_DN2521_c0_g1_i1.p1 TRINITY_DN2521_c0_g1~~TRINITY_DN2521_c0_g1_i1.p1  ORF type:complete len:570 (+),score=147.90 TRINITY_DN2521_c0_g1_i1:246-1712(+)